MKKIILLVVFFALFAQSAFGEADIGDSVDNSNTITCDQAADIIGSENCKDWIIKPAVGLWCNLPMSNETIAQFDNYYAPTYVFAPGEVCAEWMDQVD